MKILTYRSLLTNNRVWLVASQGKCGHEGYIEYRILFQNGQWLCYTYEADSYELDLVGTYPGSKGIKSVLNLVWGGVGKRDLTVIRADEEVTQ
jgi:hypothetical protein